MLLYPEYPIRRKDEGRLITLYNLKYKDMTVLKQVLGIDVAQKELVVSLGKMLSDLSIEIYGYKVFKNNEKTFCFNVGLVKKLTDSSISIRFVLEETGVYHEKLAYFLDEKGFDLSIILPNKISNHFRTLETKTITDKTCSEAIFDSIEFISSIWIDNYYAKSITFDFWTGTIAGTFFIIIEGFRLKMKRIWLYLLLTACIAYAFGFPLFLFMRELHLRKQK